MTDQKRAALYAVLAMQLINLASLGLAYVESP